MAKNIGACEFMKELSFRKRKWNKTDCFERFHALNNCFKKSPKCFVRISCILAQLVSEEFVTLIIMNKTNA